MSYYKAIKGKKLDKKLLEIAEKSVSKKGDGRISLADAKLLLQAVKDGNKYTDIEKQTMEYIRDNYKFTESADKWFRTEIRKWVATKQTKAKSNQELKTSKEIDTSEVIPLVEDIKGTETIIPPPTIPRMEALPEEIEPPTKKLNWAWILLLILFVVILFFFVWKYGCNKPPIEENISSQPTSLPEFSWEDVEKTKFSFQKGKAELSEESYPTLGKIAKLLKSNPNWKLKIIGHSCDVGTEEVNNKISLTRAEIIKNLLIERGIEKERILTEGKGESQPLYENTTEENRSKNGRVEFQLIR